MPLTITNKAAIDAAFTSKTPRPIREVMLELYPDAVEDRNGRFHAPHDGYIDPVMEREYRGGEYLPMEEDEENLRVYGRTKKIPRGVDLNGEHHSWDGTFAQNRAVWIELIRQSREYEAANCKHVGQVGEKLVCNVFMEYVHTYEGMYGTVFINIIKDADGNIIIYKGNKKLANRGERFELTAKVKEHSEREGVKQTVVWRPKAKLLP